MFVLNNSAPSGTMCTFTSNASQPFIPSGRIMAGFPMGYIINPLIQSRIDATPAQELERTIHVEGANVILSTANSSGALQQTSTFTALFSGAVFPLSTTNVSFELIPAAMVMSATATTEISANITIFGSLGGGRIEAEPFNYPVEICAGDCLVANNPTPMCGDAMAKAAANFGNPCNHVQDFYVDCCVSGTSLQCPGPM